MVINLFFLIWNASLVTIIEIRIAQRSKLKWLCANKVIFSLNIWFEQLFSSINIQISKDFPVHLHDIDICSLNDSVTISFSIRNLKWSKLHPLVNMQEDLIYTAEQITANSPYRQKHFTPFLTFQSNLFHD